MWPAAVVVTDPLPKNGANMPLAHRDHEVQAFAPDGADDAFAEGIRLWNAHRCFQDRQPHRLKRAVNPFRVDRVVIVDHESILLVAWADHPKWLGSRDAVGCAVTFQCRIRRVPTSRTTNAYRMRNAAVTTTKKFGQYRLGM